MEAVQAGPLEVPEQPLGGVQPTDLHLPQVAHVQSLVNYGRHVRLDVSDGWRESGQRPGRIEEEEEEMEKEERGGGDRGGAEG